MLRVPYEGKEANKMARHVRSFDVRRASLCVSSVIECMAWPSSLSMGSGGAISFIGVTAIRELIIRFLGLKADSS
jgi:lambda family phage holin